MSYDISIGKLDINYTGNVAAMWDEAMPMLNLRDMHGKIGIVCLPHLLQGIQNMLEYPDKYREMNPENEWGDYEGATLVLVKLAVHCELHPYREVFVSK